ncbi:MAG: glycogen synthase GlgA, partial [Aquificota bacterium]
MKVVFVVSESAPYIKTGGLGDVVHSLAKTLAKLGHTPYVIMPKYRSIKGELKKCTNAQVYFDHRWIDFEVYEDKKDDVRYHFIAYDEYYA